VKFKLPKQKLVAGLNISNFISIKSRYLVMLFSIAILCILVIGYTAWLSAYNALTESNYNQLTSIRAARAQQIENFFKGKEAHLRTLSENLMFIEALKEFSAAYDLLTLYQQVPNDKQLNELKSFYAESFYHKLRANITKPKVLQHFYPKSGTAKYLQYHYIVANPANLGEKHLLNKAPDQSYYSEVHARFHHPLRLLVEQTGLSDLFLIDKEGNLFYSVFKEVDFSTNLLSGPYAQSSLAKVVRTIMKNPDRGLVITQDFKSYDASYGAPAAFMAVPVYDRQNYVGILAIQLPVAHINSIMTRDMHWLEDGLGESGEVYLVGSDLTMRSDSRFLLENAEGYLETLKKAEVAEESLQRIKYLNTSILNQSIKTTTTNLALEGKTGHKIVQDYRGIDVLSAYAPLNINNLRWIILAEKDLAEVNKSIMELQYAIMIATVILVLITGVFSLIFASRFLKPIYDITSITTKFLAGHKVSTIKIGSSDEMGILRNAVKQLIENSQRQHEKIKVQAQENQALMLNFLPDSVVEKLQNGKEKKVTKKHPNVAIMFTSMRGFGDVISEMEASSAAQKISKLFQSFDELAKQYDIEKIAIVGDSYIVACGLNKPRLDYAARCAEFSQKLFEIVALFNQEEGLEIKLRIGISAGEVISGIIGKEHYVYSIWGNAVSIASRIRYDANPNCLRVTQLVYNQLKISDGFKKCELKSLIGIGDIGTWEYEYRPFNVHHDNEVN